MKYDLVIDRLTHWYHTSREWIKKAIIMDGLYVFNNPWSVQSMEKHSTYCAMMQLGLPIPPTWMLPPKSYEQLPDLQPTLRRYARLFDLGVVGKHVGYPMFMKPYDGGGWKAVSKIEDEKTLRAAYEQSGKLVMHLQKAVDPFDRFVRCIGLGPQTMVVLYNPSAPLHDRYTMERDFINAEERSLLEDITLTINAFFGWDFNSCESLRKDGTWYPIDFANPCPDSQVTSLHYHFPWIVKSNIRWAIFARPRARRCAGPSTGTRSTRSPRASSPTARRSRPTPGSRASAWRPTASRSSAPATSRTSTRSRSTSSAATSPRTPCARRWRRSSRRTR